MGRWVNKGQHERAMEMAKDMLNKGKGMQEIKNTTLLDNEDIEKAKQKMEGRR